MKMAYSKVGSYYKCQSELVEDYSVMGSIETSTSTV